MSVKLIREEIRLAKSEVMPFEIVAEHLLRAKLGIIELTKLQKDMRQIELERQSVILEQQVRFAKMCEPPEE